MKIVKINTNIKGKLHFLRNEENISNTKNPLCKDKLTKASGLGGLLKAHSNEL